MGILYRAPLKQRKSCFYLLYDLVSITERKLGGVRPQRPCSGCLRSCPTLCIVFIEDIYAPLVLPIWRNLTADRGVSRVRCECAVTPRMLLTGGVAGSVGGRDRSLVQSHTYTRYPRKNGRSVLSGTISVGRRLCRNTLTSRSGGYIVGECEISAAGDYE